MSNWQGAFGTLGTVSVIPESAGTGASICFEGGAIGDSDGVAVLAVGVKSADSTDPAVAASPELLATEEFGAMTS